MEREKIIFFADFIDFSEDEEPPSRCESNLFTFAFGWYRISVLKLNSVVSSIVNNLSFYSRELFPTVEFLYTLPKDKESFSFSLASQFYPSSRMVEYRPISFAEYQSRFVYYNHWATINSKKISFTYKTN